MTYEVIQAFAVSPDTTRGLIEEIQFSDSRPFVAIYLCLVTFMRYSDFLTRNFHNF